MDFLNEREFREKSNVGSFKSLRIETLYMVWTWYSSAAPVDLSNQIFMFYSRGLVSLFIDCSYLFASASNNIYKPFMEKRIVPFILTIKYYCTYLILIAVFLKELICILNVFRPTFRKKIGGNKYLETKFRFR